ncbi:carboxymuconolactone decarboxylase family protein [Acrocarpospora catenulata]|uniref:carboxymuconolactone decarboxylase family protein n=1 Tax=Acrocarpospora catenulata TaxID=2836182 RepID=UPI001BD950D7|nr:carboxymuconolactone decarboxylase family protein [Acrocarpospora catenulata]
MSSDADSTPARDDRMDRGLAVRRRILGDAYVDAALGASDSFSAPFQRFITENVWAGVWDRGVLDERSRSLVTMSTLATNGHWHEFALHVGGALRNGFLTPEELFEVCAQLAAYAGYPVALRATKEAKPIVVEFLEEKSS